VISKEKEADILRLHHAEKWPVGTIAAQLGVHHTTVQRVLQQHGVEPTLVSPKPSMVDPFVPYIREQLERFPKLRASRLFEMVKERGYPGRGDHFRRVVGRLRPKRPAEAFQRLRTLPGDQAQVDWAHFGKLACGRAQRPLWAFVMVLSYSRRLFLRFYPGASMPYFLRGHVEAFDAFQGVPRVLLYDNLKSAVLERQGDAIRFNPMLVEFAGHYRYEPRPVAVARGNEKGRVERAIRYVRESFFAGRSFTDLADLNQQAERWLSGTSDARTWVDDKTQTVLQAFEAERPSLLAVPGAPFPAVERLEVEVGKTPYVRFDLNDYSVPHDRVRRTLVVVADMETVRVLDGNAVVAEHRRSWDRDQQLEDTQHVQQLVEAKRKARETRGLDRLAKAARSSQAFLKITGERAGNIGNTTSQLLRILDAVGASELEEALVEALERDTVHIGAVRQVIDRRRSARGLLPPVMIPVGRSKHASVVVTPHALSTYDALNKPGDS
jgi:transposase